MLMYDLICKLLCPSFQQSEISSFQFFAYLM